MLPSIKGNTGFLRLVGFLEAAGWGPLVIYFPIYLENNGLSYPQIGAVIAAPMITGMFASIVWSSFSDSIGRRKPFMIQSALSISIFTFLATIISSFEWFLVLGILRGLLTPLLEGLTVASLFSVSSHRGMGRTFGGYAMWKSLGWAASLMISSILVQLLDVRFALYTSSFMFLMTAVGALRVPEVVENTPLVTTRDAVKVKSLRIMYDVLRKRRMLVFLLASLPLYAAINAAIAFFPIRLKASGTSPLLVGLIFAVPALLEVFTFSRIGGIVDTTKKKWLLILSSAIYSLEFILIGAVSEPLFLLFAYSLSEPLAWPFLFSASSILVSKILPPQRWATGQTLYRVWAWSFLPMLGSLIGGFISGILGLSAMFLIISILAAISCLLFIWVEEGY